LHGMWNLAAVTIGISSVPITSSSPPPLAGFGGAAVLLLIALAMASALGLILIWGRLARSEAERV